MEVYNFFPKKQGYFYDKILSIFCIDQEAKVEYTPCMIFQISVQKGS